MWEKSLHLNMLPLPVPVGTLYSNCTLFYNSKQRWGGGISPHLYISWWRSDYPICHATTAARRHSQPTFQPWQNIQNLSNNNNTLEIQLFCNLYFACNWANFWSFLDYIQWQRVILQYLKRLLVKCSKFNHWLVHKNSCLYTKFKKFHRNVCFSKLFF